MHEPTNNLVMHRTEPSHLQALALQLSEKLSSLVDYNERALDFKSGSFFVTKTGFYNQDNLINNISMVFEY